MTTNDSQVANYNRLELELRRRFLVGEIPAEQVIAALKRFIEGDFERMQSVRYPVIINCDADPFVPDDMSVVKHRLGGLLEFDPANIVLHLEPEQQRGDMIKGKELRKRLQGKQILNVCVLDFLLANTSLIPENWKSECLLFLGTEYRDSVGSSLIVRCLFWRDNQWQWDLELLDDYEVGRLAVAVLA